MKLKTFILTFLMMMSCSISFGQGTETASATTEAQLWLHLNDDEIGTISLANDIKITATCPIPNGKKVTIDLNGHKLFTEEEIYIINNEGKLTITDNSEGKTGTISSTLGIYNGVTPTRTSVTDVKYDRVLTINGGVFNSSSTNGNAATIYNYRGVIKINGGEFYGEHSAITNYGMATIANAYIECLNRDNGAAAIINDFEIAYGENVNIVGGYTAVTGTAYTTGTEPTYLFAELNGTKYPSLQAALDACTTGNNTINLLFHNSYNATVSQKEGVNITIDGNGYKGKQFEYTGTITVDGKSAAYATAGLTIEDVKFNANNITKDASINLGGNNSIRYTSNVTVKNCTFEGVDKAKVAIKNYTGGCKNLVVKNCEATGLHSLVQVKGIKGVTVEDVKVTDCKNGISVGTSDDVAIKGADIEAEGYGLRADGSGKYSLNVENSTLSAEVPVIVRNTTGEEYKLTVAADVTLTATNGGPQVVVTKDSDDDPYVVPTAKINVTLNNDASTFGLVAKIGNKYYSTLDEAFAVATEGQTITLLADATPVLTSQRAITKAAVIDLGGKTLTLTEDDLYFGTTEFKNGNIIVDPSVNASTAVFWMFENQTLTFDNVELTATDVTGTYLIGINGGTGSNVNLLNGTKIIINNESKAALSAVICDNGTGNNVKIENSDIDVKNIEGRFYLGGTSGNITVDNTDIDLNGVKEGFYLRVNQTLSIGENTTIDVVLNETEGRYGINFTDVNYTYTVAETATVNATVYEPVAIAQIGTIKYPTLQGAIDAVKDGETIKLLADCAEAVHINKTNVAFTIDGQISETEKVDFSGVIGINIGQNVTIRNIDFKGATANHDFIKNEGSPSGKNYNTTLLVENCSFTGNPEFDVVGVRTTHPTHTQIVNCTADGLHSLLQNTGGQKVTADKVVVINGKEGGLALGGVRAADVKNSEITANGYGIRIDAATPNAVFNIESSEFNAYIPVIARKATAQNVNFTFSGENTMTQTNDDDVWFVIENGNSGYHNGNVSLETLVTPTGIVNVTLNDTGLDRNGIYGNYGVAKINNAVYNTFADALNAVQDGETITVLNVEGSESSKEIEFTKDIEFTITGTAPKYALPIVTFQNATVNIKDAKILIPELDARQNATINVIDSEVDDAGGNSIAKSYYNGALNISGNSVVYMMQVTTMGYINISGTAKLHATWQTNVYGNGLVTIKDNATFNTAALHLTGQDYSNRDNTDADRVGKPAEIVVDGANFTVGNVQASNGADYSYNSSKGINVGTVEGKSAILNIMNGGNVNIYMANGETANIGAGGTVNVAASTLKTICRSAEGEVTLANNGTMNVTGTASINIKKLTGNAINFTDVTIADAYIGGRVNAFGTNNFSGETNVTGIFSVGYYNASAAPVVVNVTGNFNGGNVLIGSSNEHVLNLGNAEGGRTTAHFATQLGAFGVVNINNADVTYQYAFIRNDFNVINSTMEVTHVNTYIAGNAEVVVDNSTWKAGAYARIGEYDGMFGNANVTLKNGSVMTATNLNIILQEGKTVKVTIEDNSRLEATNLTNQGSIVLDDVKAKVTSNEFDNAPTTTVAYHKVNYVEGSYVVVAKDYVAQIYDVNDNTNDDRRYESLAEAATAAQDGETIKLLWNEGDAAISMNASFFGKNVTITGDAKVDWSEDWFFVGRGGEGNATVTFDGANLTSASANGNSGLGIHVSGREKNSDNKYNGTLVIKNSTIELDYLIDRGTITLDEGANLTVKNGFGIAGRPAHETEDSKPATATISLVNGAKLIVDNHNGMGVGQAATVPEGYGIMNIDATSTFETTQNFNISANGTMNVNGGNVKVVGTLTNAGTVYVTGAANLDANVTGNGWFYMNGVTLDADTELLGAKVGFINGENNIVGSTIKDGWFSVGIGKDTDAETAAAFATANGITLGGVTVNVSDNATVYTSTDAAYSGWVGSAYSAANKGVNEYILNINNSLARFGYMHVSKDGEMNVTGPTDNKYEYAGNAVDFYAGTFINNGNVTLNGVDAWAQYTKISVDHADAVLNITNYTKYEANCTTGNVNASTFLYYNAGTVNIDETSSVNIEKATTLVEGAELNIASNNVIAKGDVTGDGAINLTDLNAKFTAKEGLTIVDKVNNKDYKIVYQDGTYQFVAKQFVAQIYDVNDNTNDDRRYESLQEAIEKVEEGETVKLMADVTITEPAYGQNALNHARAINFTLDLNGKTLSADTGNSVFRFNIAGSGATDDVTVTIKNGTVVSGEDTWCTLMSTGISADVRAVMNLEDLVIENNKGGDFAVKAWANGVVNAEEVTINSTYGGGFYALGGEITLENCTVNQEGLWTAPYLSVAVAVSNGGKMTVNSGTYSAAPKAVTDGYNQGTSHGSACAQIMSSGGTLIINGGTFSNDNFGDNSLATAARYLIYADAKGDLQINGGTFNALKGIIDNTTNTGADVATVTLKGGTYSANPKPIYNGDAAIPAGYIVVDNENGTFSVVEDQVAKIGDVTYKLLQEAFNAAEDGQTIVVLKDITYTKANGYVNVNSDYIDGLVYTGDKSFTVDFGGYTITDNGEINDYLVYLKNQDEKDNEITFKNGTIAIKAERTNTAWAAITVGANSATYKTTLNLDNMKVVNGNPNNESNQVIRTRNGATVNLNNNTVVTSNGTSYGVVAETGSIVNINSGAKVVQQESGTTSGNEVYTAVSGNGTINIYDGATIVSDNYAIHNMTSGNAVINIFGGTITAPVAVHVATNGGGDESAVANISGGTFTGALETETDAASIVITGGTFSEDPTAYCAEGYGVKVNGDGTYSVIMTSGTQEIALAYGWNWFSSYIDLSGETGLEKVQTALGTNGVQIKGKFNNNSSSYQDLGNGTSAWIGDFDLSTKQMYMINTSAAVTMEIEGNVVDREETTISLGAGWNWISYPLYETVDINEALANHNTAADGDAIKTLDKTSVYYSSLDKWIGDLTELTPGQGYMYKSANATSFVYSAGSSRSAKSDAVSENKFWKSNANKFANNMTIVAMLSIDGELVNDNYEIAAFANGECRGSARPVYVEELDQHILFLTINGEDVQELTFKYYDVNYGTVYELNNRINYSNDAVLGSIDEPYMFNLGILNIEEATLSDINIYPNPTTTGTEINLNATCDTVEVFNALGVKVAEYQNVDTIDALETAGIYVIRITNNGNVQNCRLVVK